MMLEKLLSAIFQFREFKYRRDDDFVDRLNRQYTPAILVLFTIVISVKQYVGAPIDCWCPAQFTESQVDYANTICWVNNTYYVAFDDSLPLPDQRRRFVSYYQWVPFILLTQAMCFFFPCLLWRFFSRRAGLNIAAILETAQACQRALYAEARDTSLRYVVVQVDAYLRRAQRAADHQQERAAAARRACCSCASLRQRLAYSCCWVFTSLSGNYLSCAYVFVKSVYIVNAVGQLLILDSFLGMERGYYWFGWTVVQQLLERGEIAPSDRFPRVTLCDFHIRQAANVHRYTVQCVLPINIFNEKIFTFIWFWLVVLGVTTTLSACSWVSLTCLVGAQTPHVHGQLRAAASGGDRGERRDPRVVRRFTVDYLQRDGLLVTRLIARNSGELVSAEVLCGLWQNYGPETKGERYRRGRLYPPSGGPGGEDETCIEGALQGNGSQKSTARKRWFDARSIFSRVQAAKNKSELTPPAGSQGVTRERV